MTDDLDDLKAALRALPTADPAVKAATIALAMKNFDSLQGSGQGSPDAPRPNQDRKIRRGS